MPRYQTYGTLDDKQLEDYDSSFIGFNNRLRPDNLKAGLFSDAKNFRFDLEGVAQVRKGISILSNPVTLDTNTEFILPFYLYANVVSNSLSSSSLVGDVLTLNFGGPHEIVNGTTIGVSLTDPLTNFNNNSNFKANVTSTTQLTITIPNVSGTPTGTATVGAPYLSENFTTATYASANYTDAYYDSKEYIILVSNDSAFGVRISDAVSFKIGYPINVQVTENSNTIQAFYKSYIFRKGSTALENTLKISDIASAVLDNSTSKVTVTTVTNHHLETGDKVTISNLIGSGSGGAVTTDPNGVQKEITKTGDKTFTYALSGGNETYVTTTNPIVCSDYTKVESGTYTQPTLKGVTNDCTIINGICTVTISNSGADKVIVGDIISIVDKGGTGLTVGDTYEIATSSDTDFTFNIPEGVPNVGTAGAGNGVALDLTVRLSSGQGFTHMPAPEFGVTHSNRLAVPYFFSTGVADDVFTSRNVDDEILISGAFKPDTFDTPFATFITSQAGDNDSLVGLFSFADDKLVVFNRKSISLIQNVNSVGFRDTVNQLITQELGLVARKSIIQVGNELIFLSDNGVYGLSFEDLYNLRGSEVPLSESINLTMNDINKDLWDKSTGVYFNNRYYLAVPLNTKDSDGNTVLATGNNAILVYNFLNRQWESVDTVASVDGSGNPLNFEVLDLIVAGEGDKRAVYATSSLGAIHQLEGMTIPADQVITSVGATPNLSTIPASLTTRLYNAGVIDRKKWKDFEFHVQGGDYMNVNYFDITAQTENTDYTLDLGNVRTYNNGENITLDEDVSVRGRIGNPRGYGIKFTFDNFLGRVKFKLIKTTGAIAFNSTERAI